MKNDLTYDQLTMLIERATRERNAAVSELVTTLPGKILAWAAQGAEKFRQARAVNVTAPMKAFGGSASI